MRWIRKCETDIDLIGQANVVGGDLPSFRVLMLLLVRWWLRLGFSVIAHFDSTTTHKHNVVGLACITCVRLFIFNIEY